MKANNIILKHHSLIKCQSLLPLLFKVSELSYEIGVPNRTLRDWLAKGAPYIRNNRQHIWIYGPLFRNWVLSQCTGK